MLKVRATQGRARRGSFETIHGAVQTPAFMNVVTAGAIKGAVSTLDLKELKCQVQFCDTYHLHLRPGDESVYQLGGLHHLTRWDGPTLTDSGGSQVFSLTKLRNIREEGVTFSSHIGGHKIFMGPGENMQIQSHLASAIATAFDECVENLAEYAYAKQSCARTTRRLHHCKAEMDRLNTLPGIISLHQMLQGINQGSTYEGLHIEYMKQIRELDLPGYTIGGLAVGESTQEMYRIIEAVEPEMPADKPRYLVGIGTPDNILKSARRGVDLFDCVMPTRNARHAHLSTWQGRRNLLSAKYALNDTPLDSEHDCPVCRSFSRAYLHHLFKAGEILAMRLAVMHNIYFYNTLIEKIHYFLKRGSFDTFYLENVEKLGQRI